MLRPYKKEQSPDFSNPKDRDIYTLEAHNKKELLQKEVDVNRAEQELLNQRIQMMKSFVNDLPESDPQQSMVLTQIRMDQIELDELKIRENEISYQLEG